MMGHGMIYGGMTNGGMWLWMILGTVFWVLLIVGIVLLAVFVVQKTLGSGGRTEETALEVLKKRYARGEISKEEYRDKKQDLV